MSTNLARRTPDDICKEINACSIKLVQAEKKVEDWKDTRRCLIQELKDNYPDVWLKEVKEKCNIGRAMAYRILQLPSAGKEKSSENNGSESTSRQAEYSSEERAEQQEERPPDIAIGLSRKAPETPEELAADAMLLVASFLEQYQIDPQLTRAALIRMLTEAQRANVIEGDAAAEKSPSAKKRGRPPGSKNKPKEAVPAPEPEESPQAGADRQRRGHGGDGRGAQGGCCRGRARGDAGRRQHSRVSAARSARAAGATMSTAPSTSALRAERLMLVARYDCYAFSPAIFLVVKELETEISWLRHSLWRRQQGEMSNGLHG